MKWRNKKTKLKIAAAAVIGLTLVAALFQFNTAKAAWTDPYNIVDVLMIGDEEFLANPDWKDEAENKLEYVSSDRFEESNIKFYMRGWLAWDSLDSETNRYELMQEAIIESGLPKEEKEIHLHGMGWAFKSGSEWVDDNGLPWHIDLLLIFTGQDMDYIGYSLDVCNAAIIRHGHVGTITMTHELGHQFHLEHCGTWYCVMKESPVNKEFCEGENGCRAKLTRNANKWHMDEYTPLAPAGESACNRSTQYWYKVRVVNPDGNDVQYEFDWGDGSAPWTVGWFHSGWNATVWHIWTSPGTYDFSVRAKDSAGHESDWSPSLQVTVVNRIPNIPSTPTGPEAGNKYTSYSYNTSTIDPDGDDVRYQFHWGDETPPTLTDWYDSGETATASHTWTSEGIKYVTVRAEDRLYDYSDWSESLPVMIVNGVPNIPSTPTGATLGYRGAGYFYRTNTTDPDGDDVCYQFDWDDGWTTTTPYYDSGKRVTSFHVWASTGTYNVRVRAKDSASPWSGWSPSLEVSIVNGVPNIPSTPVGPTSGYYGYSYTYNTSTTDPDGDDVQYEYYWDDGTTTTTDWYPSGSLASVSHMWYSPGIYDVTVRAKDDYGVWSDQSDPLTVNITDDNPGGGGGGEFGMICPRLFVWNGSDYAEDFIFDLHGDSDVTMHRTIGQPLVPENDHYLLSLRELGDTISYIDYVKLYAVDAEGVMHECHLTNAVHSELGNVKQLLLCDDDERIDLGPSQTIDFKFNMPDVENIDYFIFEIQGYEPN